jgi:hypothetical protein
MTLSYSETDTFNENCGQNRTFHNLYSFLIFNRNAGVSPLPVYSVDIEGHSKDSCSIVLNT